MRRRRLVVALGVLALLAAAALLLRFEYAPLPDEADLLNPERNPVTAAYDLLGRAVTAAEAEELGRTPEGRRMLTPAEGATRIDAETIRNGREAFYRETYGNEVFLTDILGLIDGGLSPWTVARSLIALGGRGTADLEVRLAQPVTLGERRLEAGTPIRTGLDVPRGGIAPLGIKVVYDRGRIRMGVTCALCHAAVDPASGRVVDGAPNTNLNLGLMLALASNSSAYFMHTSMPSLDPYRTDPSRLVRTSDGRRERLPDPAAFERDVDAMLAAWPAGSFDSSPDLVNNPTSVPSSFSAHAQPYGWSGHAAIGPFRGLTALNNNVHGLNSDTAAQAAAAPVLFGLDPETYLGTLLQGAANPRFRYRPDGAEKPTATLDRADPTPGIPGVNHYAVLPSFPRTNFVTTNSLIASVPGEPVGFSINAMSPYQDRLRPPPSPAADPAILARGRAAFERAGCGRCHSGPAFTNNQVLPQPEVGTEPTRALSFRRTEEALAPPALFPFDLPTPPPAGALTLPIPMNEADAEQAKLAYAHGGTPGGYKVQNLIGLAWTAPYLHDGGVAVGPNDEVGVAATLFAGVQPDPRLSLKALLDRTLRARVVAANRAAPQARASHVTGEGHPFWADREAGFSEEDQAALVAYLLSLDRPSAPQ